MDNGATEIPGQDHRSKLLFLGSPIRFWWTPSNDPDEGPTLHETARFRNYARFRGAVRDEIAALGRVMVYAPHLALKGDWDEEIGTFLNDQALRKASIFFRIRVYTADRFEVPAEGTDHEQDLASELGLVSFETRYCEDEILRSVHEFRDIVLPRLREEIHG